MAGLSWLGVPTVASARTGSPEAWQTFEVDGLWGYRTDAGTVVLPPRYAVATPFTTGGIAWVADADGLHWIRSTGTPVARPFAFDNGADGWSNGRARIVDEAGQVGFIDVWGNAVVPPTWSFAAPYAAGRAVVCRGCRTESDGEHRRPVGGTWGVIDRAGTVVVPPTLGSWSEATAAARDVEPRFERRPLSLDPRDVQRHPTDGTALVSPGSDRKASAYTHYWLDLSGVDAALGPASGGPVDVVIEVWRSSEQALWPHDVTLPSPDGLLRITTIEGRVVAGDD